MIMSPRVPCRVPILGFLCVGLLAALSAPAWSLDDPTAPAAMNPANEAFAPALAAAGAPADLPSGSDATADPLATGTSSDGASATTNPANDPFEPPSAAASAPSNLPTGSDVTADPLATGSSSDAAPAASPIGSPYDANPPAVPTVPRVTDSFPATAGAERIEQLERQLDTLRNELRALRGERLSAADSMLMPARSADKNGFSTSAPSEEPNGWIGPPAFSPDGTWSAVATRDGRIAIVERITGKELRRIDLDVQAKPLMMAFDPQGSVLRVGSADGTITLFDAATGRKLGSMKTTPHGAVGGMIDGDKTSDDMFSSRYGMVGLPAFPAPAADLAAPQSDFATTRLPRAGSSLTTNADTTSSSPSSLAQSLAGAQIDLIRLATEYTDAVGEQKLTARQLQRLQALVRSNAISETEVVTAEVHHETASNKVALLRAIAEAAAEATKGELEFAERMVEKGYGTPASVSQLKAKLRIISLILDGGTPRPSEPTRTY